MASISACVTPGCGSNTPVVENAPQQSALLEVSTKVSGLSEQINTLMGNIENVAQQSALLKVRTEVHELSVQLDALSGNVQEARSELVELQERGMTISDSDLEGVGQEYFELRERLPALAIMDLAPELETTDWILGLRQSLSAPLSIDRLLDAELLLQRVPLAVNGPDIKALVGRYQVSTVQLASEYCEAETPEYDRLEQVVGLLADLQPVNDEIAQTCENLSATLNERLSAARRDEMQSELSKEAIGIQDQLDGVTAIEDADIRRAALAKLSQQVDAIRLELALEGIDDDSGPIADTHRRLNNEIANSLNVLAQERRQDSRRARMRYQAWALREIQKMKSFLNNDQMEKVLYRLLDESAESKDPVKVLWADFAGVRKQFEKGIGTLPDNLQLSDTQKAMIGPFVKDNWDSLLYQVKHDAACRHLLPIDQNALDPPVAKFYSEAFEKVWTQIEDGDGMQLSLAKRSTRIPKRSPDELVEKRDD